MSVYDARLVKDEVGASRRGSWFSESKEEKEGWLFAAAGLPTAKAKRTFQQRQQVQQVHVNEQHIQAVWTVRVRIATRARIHRSKQHLSSLDLRFSSSNRSSSTRTGRRSSGSSSRSSGGDGSRYHRGSVVAVLVLFVLTATAEPKPKP